MEECICVVDLRKHYRVHERAPGLWNAIKSLLRRQYRLVKAVDGISFSIRQGEIVGFLGPNGAGKTTTLKVLAGLLHPTSGQVRVLGFEPFRRHPDFLRRITLVMGQRSQLVWDLPPMETFLLHKALYDLSDAAFRDALDELVALLDLAPLLSKPVRQLSLGERMRCELALALLHRPQVLFLDEPTLGLDVLAQAQIRQFIREYNRRTQATILLTSHYMDDVLALCRRVMVINHGHLLYDGDLDELLPLRKSSPPSSMPPPRRLLNLPPLGMTDVRRFNDRRVRALRRFKVRGRLMGGFIADGVHPDAVKGG